MWDPDHLPCGALHTARRAVQIGLRGEWVTRAAERTAGIDDVTWLAEEQRSNAAGGGEGGCLLVRAERVYLLPDDLRRLVGADTWDAAAGA